MRRESLRITYASASEHAPAVFPAPPTPIAHHSRRHRYSSSTSRDITQRHGFDDSKGYKTDRLHEREDPSGLTALKASTPCELGPSRERYDGGLVAYCREEPAAVATSPDSQQTPSSTGLRAIGRLQTTCPFTNSPSSDMTPTFVTVAAVNTGLQSGRPEMSSRPSSNVSPTIRALPADTSPPIIQTTPESPSLATDTTSRSTSHTTLSFTSRADGSSSPLLSLQHHSLTTTTTVLLTSTAVASYTSSRDNGFTSHTPLISIFVSAPLTAARPTSIAAAIDGTLESSASPKSSSTLATSATSPSVLNTTLSTTKSTDVAASETSLPAASPQSRSSAGSSTVLGVAIGVTAAVILLLLLVFCLFRRRRKQKTSRVQEPPKIPPLHFPPPLVMPALSSSDRRPEPREEPPPTASMEPWKRDNKPKFLAGHPALRPRQPMSTAFLRPAQRNAFNTFAVPLIPSRHPQRSAHTTPLSTPTGTPSSVTIPLAQTHQEADQQNFVAGSRRESDKEKDTTTFLAPPSAFNFSRSRSSTATTFSTEPRTASVYSLDSHGHRRKSDPFYLQDVG